MNRKQDRFSTLRMRVHLSILREVQKDYPRRTIDNIISNYEAILKEREEHERRDLLPDKGGHPL